MKYNATLIVYNPEDNKKRIQIDRRYEFVKSDSPYGNGYYLWVSEKEYDYNIDIRYDMTFDKNNPIAYLTNYICNHWNGKNGAYLIDTLHISKDNTEE